jgi:ERF superfamily
MNHSDQINEMAAALAKAQGMIEPVAKNREVSIRTKSGATYKFAYATLDAIREVIRKPLSDNGIALVQSVDDSDGTAVTLTTSLFHSSGQWMKSHLKLLMEDSGNQARGSAITYARRYAISSILGIVTEEDDDGNTADGNEIKVSKTVASQAKAFEPDEEMRDKAQGWVAEERGSLNLLSIAEDVKEWQRRKAKPLSRLKASYPDLHQQMMEAYDLALERVTARV